MRDTFQAVAVIVVALLPGALNVWSYADVRVLDEVDLFEVSLTPSPMNADTRVLSMKSARLEPRRIASFEC